MACYQPQYLLHNQICLRLWLLYRYKCLYQHINMDQTSLNKSSHKQQSLLSCHGSYCVCNRTIHLRDSCQSLSQHNSKQAAEHRDRPREESRLRVSNWDFCKWLEKTHLLTYVKYYPGCWKALGWSIIFPPKQYFLRWPKSSFGLGRRNSVYGNFQLMTNFTGCEEIAVIL